MLPQRAPNVGWSDSDSTMGREEASDKAKAPSSMLKIVIRPPKMDEQDVTKKAKKPARKTTSAPSAKAQATGEDMAAKAKTLKVAKVRAAKEPKPKPVKEVKVKPTKQAKVKPAKDTPTKVAKAKPVKEPDVENVTEKSVKNELMELKIAEVKEPKVRRTAVTTRKRNQTAIAGQPKWSVPGISKLENQAETAMPLNPGRPCDMDLRPRIWCSSKEELVSALPELAKGANGVSWIQSEPPTIFLEDDNVGMIVSDVSKDGSHSMELKMTRSFVCDPADLGEPSDTSTPKFPCSFRVSPSFQPVDLKTKFTFDSRPKFIPAEVSQFTPETSQSKSKPVTPKAPQAKRKDALPKPETLQSKPFAPQPVSPAVAQDLPPRSLNPAPSHVVAMDIEPESEQDKKHQELTYRQQNLLPIQYYRAVLLRRPHSENVAEYEIPTTPSFPSFPSPSVECAPSASALTSPTSPADNPRRCTCDMIGNIYCGVCDVTLESETDPKYQTHKPRLRYVPARYLIMMSNSKSHADADDVTMSKNIFDVQSTTFSGAQATQPTCSCYMSRNASCSICSPTTSYPDPFLIDIDDAGISSPSSSTLHPPNRPTPPSHKQLSKKTLPVTSRVRLRIPALGASSRAADSQTIQVLPGSSPNEELAHTPVESTPHVLPQIPPNLITIPQEMPLNDLRIPNILPPEVQVIIDAYISGTPLNVVASRSMLKTRWGVSIPAEYGYVYMGFFAVAEVLEERVMPSPTSGESTPERAVGEVQWRIKCIWSASGEEDADLALGSGAPQPWWDPISVQSPSPQSNVVSLFYSRRNPLDPIRRPRKRSHSANDSSDDAYPDKSTPRYRIAQRQHPNARYGLGTGAKLGDRYWSVLPNHVRGRLGGWDQGFGYEGVPSGWWCERCGRVNFQAQWRMRWCSSEQCLKATNKRAWPQGLAVPLDVIRDPMHVMPVTHPSDTYPGGGSVNCSVDVWKDSMRTFMYVVREARGGADVPQVTGNAGLNPSTSASTSIPTPPLASSSAGASTSTFSLTTSPNPNAHSFTEPAVSVAVTPAPRVIVKHIFTGNISRLQARATELLLEMQKNVPLRRAIGDPGPYFTYSVSSDPGGTTASWQDAPAIITRAKETMEFYMREYGEVCGFEMNRLDAFSWVATGTRKGSSALKCRKRPVVLMCLGSETFVNVVPKSGFREPDPRGVPGNRVLGFNLGPDLDLDLDPDADSDAELDGLVPMDVDEDMDVVMEAPYDDRDTVMLDLEPEIQADHSLPPRQRGQGPALESAAPASKGKGKGKAKAPVSAPASAARKPKPKPRKRDISVLLLHGDMMMLVGDDYEYTIKRTGTSVLLVGSYVGANEALAITMPSTPGGRVSKSKRQAKV